MFFKSNASIHSHQKISIDTWTYASTENSMSMFLTVCIYMYMFKTYNCILINISMIWIFSNSILPCNDGSVLPRYQISAMRRCCGGRSNPSSRAPTKSWTGDQGWNENWDNATLLPQTWAKGAQVLLQKKLKVVLRWFRYLKAGVVISVLRWAMCCDTLRWVCINANAGALLPPSTNPTEMYLTSALPGHGRGAFESSDVCRSGEESLSRFWRSSAPAARHLGPSWHLLDLMVDDDEFNSYCFISLFP